MATVERVRVCDTPAYSSWEHMKQRCLNPNDTKYADYGGRGISVCDAWMIFSQFLSDMGPRPKGLELDRIDNDGNYEPGNCKWSTRQEQLRNRRVKGAALPRGVYLDKRRQVNPWHARLSLNNRTIHLGGYNTLEEAVKARELGEAQYWNNQGEQ